jgi:Uma2 family endonuclease
MSGGSLAHNRISANILASLQGRAREHGCEVLPADMRIRVPKSPPYRYAHIVVACGPPQIETIAGLDVLTNPTVIVEILSDSTEAYDRGKKFVGYQSVETFREYLLVAQDRAYITQYVKQPDGGWLREDIEGADKEITLASVMLTFSLREIYDRVELPPQSA